MEICLAGSSRIFSIFPKILSGLSFTKYSGEAVALNVHHLYRVANECLLIQWLLVFLNLSQYVDEKVLCQQATAETEILSSTPDCEVWQQYLVLGKTKHTFSSQLVGKERQRILLVNVVLPFFLAYARHENYSEIEKLLYRLFIILPEKASNSKIRFMKKFMVFRIT